MIPKFRAWGKTRNEWSNGFFIYSEGGLYTPNYGFNRKHLKNRTDVYPIVKQERFILMQSTGLFDKNGVEIFEGDVVVVYNELNEFEPDVYEVVYSQDNLAWMFYDEESHDFYWMSTCTWDELEIIGNVHQNLELVEG